MLLNKPKNPKVGQSFNPWDWMCSIDIPGWILKQPCLTSTTKLIYGIASHTQSLSEDELNGKGQMQMPRYPIEQLCDTLGITPTAAKRGVAEILKYEMLDSRVFYKGGGK